MNSVKIRVEQRLADTGMNKPDLARKIGISTQALNNWFNRDNIPGDKLFEVAKELGCDPKWLNTGEEIDQDSGVQEPAQTYNTEQDLMDEILDAFEIHLNQTGDFWPIDKIIEEADQLYEIYKNKKHRPTQSNLIKIIKLHEKAKNKDSINKTT